MGHICSCSFVVKWFVLICRSRKYPLLCPLYVDVFRLLDAALTYSHVDGPQNFTQNFISTPPYSCLLMGFLIKSSGNLPAFMPLLCLGCTPSFTVSCAALSRMKIFLKHSPRTVFFLGSSSKTACYLFFWFSSPNV